MIPVVMNDDIPVWHVQRWDQELGLYADLDAAKEHANHAIGFHFEYVMDRNRVPRSYRVVDWRRYCCGGLLGPGFFNHTVETAEHAEKCAKKGAAELLLLYPYWVVDGRPVQTGHVSTAWEICQGVARARFNPGAPFVR